MPSENTTTNQVSMNLNPTGKGGFGDHPEHRSDGRWSKDNSYTYWMNYFKTLSRVEFDLYPGTHPDMTIAALGAYERLKNSIGDLRDFQEVANRTEGMPIQRQEITERPILKLDGTDPVNAPVVAGDNAAPAQAAGGAQSTTNPAV